MRKRRTVVLAAGGRWPDGTGGFGMAFNWVKIDNRGGTNTVEFGLTANMTAGDPSSGVIGSVSKGVCRVFNVAGPKTEDGPGEDWPLEIFLVSASGTTVVLEIADHPIVDMSFAT